MPHELNPDSWPFPIEQVHQLFEGANKPGGMVELWGSLYGRHSDKHYVIETVPRDEAKELIIQANILIRTTRALLGRQP